MVQILKRVAFFALLSGPLLAQNINWDQILSTDRHGTGTNGQASDGTGFASHLAIFNADGSLTDGGLPPPPVSLVYLPDKKYFAAANCGNAGVSHYTTSWSSQTSVTVTHNLGTSNVLVQVYDGSGVLVSPESVTATSSNVVTLTFGASFTGSVVVSGIGTSNPGALWNLPASSAPTATCHSGSNVKDGYLAFADGQSAQVSFLLPPDWDASSDLDARIFLTDSSTSGTVIFQAATSCSSTDGSATDDQSFNTAQSFGTLTLGSPASAGWAGTLSGLTKTGCAPGSFLHVKLNRTTDTAAGAANISGLELTVRRSFVVTPGSSGGTGGGGGSGGGGTTTGAGSGGSTVTLASRCPSAGTGGDDTSCLQSSMDATASAGSVLEIASGTYHTNHLVCPSGLNLLLDSSVTLQAVSGIGPTTVLLDCSNQSNITLKGTSGSSIIKGLKSEYTSSEYRHCLSVAGATNVLIDGISCNESGGDGLYIGEGTRGYAQNIEVKNATFNDNSRNGISLISCNICNIHDSSMTNTKGENGAAPDGPWAGLDIEPNTSTNRLVAITLTNNTLTGNGVTGEHSSSNGNGIIIHIDPIASNAVSITASGNTTSSNVNDGIHITNASGGPSGTVTFTSHTASGNGRYGAWAQFYDATGPQLSITGSTFSNNNSAGITTDDADFGIVRGGGGTNNMGNVVFTGNSITSTNGHLTYYFTVEDFSSIGLAHITIGSFGTLSGASGGTNGLLNGSGVSSVSVP